ncbi:MFS transporter [Burkholderia sp. S171]|uniref:MFS transporter n=1 Tax=Burkholderia sp. S171 TaxID=1641860 RepID=UPI00131D7ABF|nr:MFS transporter [Burkholderia sp. S171]
MLSESPSVAGAFAGDSVEATYKRVAWRIVPLLFVCYIVAYMDRVNVGFAKLQMLADLGFSDTIYGLGAGFFFLGYFLFEVPSNLLLHRFGARRWIARIMITWAVLSMATACVTTPAAFYVIRFLLGIAEAGFFPGVILYLTYWFPSHRRGRMTAWFMAGNPISGIIGGPLSGLVMKLLAGSFGLSGWQWLFIIEALPAIVMGIVVYHYLDDKIADARWLRPDQKALISAEIERESRAHTHGSIRSVLVSARVWLLCFILFGIVMGSYAIGFWQPTLIRLAGIEDPLTIGMLSMIPYAAALLSMLLTARHADRTRERRWHLAVPALVASVGFSACALSGSHLYPAMIGMTLAAIGVITALPMFWALPTGFLGGAGAAAGIALINCTGNLAGFVSPSVIGWLKNQTHSLSSGLFLVAAMIAVAGISVVMLIPAKLVNR